jgi:serine/threonine protein kinase/tetratricopeptide (TPR) repeat protein
MNLAPNQAKTIFLNALEIAAGSERDAYVNAQCGNDPAVREEVEGLLRHHAAHGSFLEAPVERPLTVDHAPALERPGVVIGSYKLMEQIGEGGMGLVFVAEQQQPVRRKVALKVIKPGMDTRQVIARFEAERQALALMDHPNIAKVLDGGETASGRPYFVMELVKGVPITDFCDQNHVPIRQRLELFIHVCQAVQHAHQKGIIHRDIKPSNVMIVSHDGTPVPKIIDFGVAKAIGQQLTDKTLYTQLAQLIGTPLYMSPEQAGHSGLDIDTRTDIYALGVLLYELLTGTTPFAKERLHQVAYDQMLRIIRDEEPPKPSTRIVTLGKSTPHAPAAKSGQGNAPTTIETIATQRKIDPQQLSRLLRRELDWIVMKCLEKDRNRRYETANGLAMDLRRYLHDEPVQACPPSAAYRFRKLLRRNKVLFATLTTVTATLLVASAAVTWKWWEAETARQQEQAAKEEATEKEKQAKEDRDRALRAELLARLREAEALIGQAHGIRLSGRPGRRFDALAALSKAATIGRELGKPASWFDWLRNEAIAALALPDLHITKEFGSFPPGSVWVDVSDDFELYAVTTDKGSCTIRRVADDTLVAHLAELGEPAHVQFGSGRTLALRGGGDAMRFQLWDLSGDMPAQRFKEKRGITNGTFHPKGHLVALAHSDGPISVYDVTTGTLLHSLPAKEVVQHLALLFHPTMPFLATTSYWSRNVWVYDLRTEAVVASAATPRRNAYGAWSPDGRTLTVPPGDAGKILQYAFDPESPALRPLRALDSTQSGAEIYYNQTGDRFVDYGWGRKVHLFDAASGQVLFWTNALPPEAGFRLRFDRTGQRLAAARVGDRSDRIGIWSVADAREYRALRHTGAPEGTWAELAIHPRGRLAATTLLNTVALFDLDSGRELAQLPTGPDVCALCFDGTGNLLINARAGFYRWPVRPDRASPGRLLVGPPDRLPFQVGNRSISASKDGHVIAQSMWNGYDMPGGGWILHPKFAAAQQVLPGTSTTTCSVSPDGRWVVFNAPQHSLTVYESASAQRAWQLRDRQDIVGRFSPDGQWLVTDADGGQLFAAGTWKPGPRLGPGTPWDMTARDARDLGSPQLAVLGLTNGIYRLVEVSTGRELARLEDPDRNGGPAAFTPDGTKLVVTAKDSLRVWDLRRIRAELAKLELDWEAPAYPPAVPADPKEMHVQVDLGDLVAGEKYNLILAFLPLHAEAYFQRGMVHLRLYRTQQAISDFTMALTLKADHAGAYYQRALLHARQRRATQAIADFARSTALGAGNRAAFGVRERGWNTAGDHNSLAWVLATHADPKLRDPVGAMAMAKIAVELSPKVGTYWNTLGAAQYRAGDWKGAIAALNKSMELDNGGSADDFFFLAMACERLGQKEHAQKWYKQAAQWVEKNGQTLAKDPPHVEELRRFSDEAAEVLGIKDEQKPKLGK